MQWRPALASLATLVMISACSENGDERAYSIPRQLCGIEIDRQQYEPLLPPGDTLEVEDFTGRDSGRFTSSYGSCMLSVDGQSALSLNSESAEEWPDLRSFALHSRYGLEYSDSEPVPGSRFEARVWPATAMAFLPCEESSSHNSGLAFYIVAYWTDDDLSEELSAVIDAYVEPRLNEINPDLCGAGP